MRSERATNDCVWFTENSPFTLVYYHQFKHFYYHYYWDLPS